MSERIHSEPPAEPRHSGLTAGSNTGPSLEEGVIDVDHTPGSVGRVRSAATSSGAAGSPGVSDGAAGVAPVTAGSGSDGARSGGSRRSTATGRAGRAAGGDTGGESGAVSDGGKRRRRGLVRVLQLRMGLVARRWRQSLQFRAVSVALVGALVVFLVTGAFLSHQISERLFNDRLDQVLTQSEADFNQVQASFDASDAVDRDQLQTLVNSTLDALESDPDTSQRRWLLVPLSTDTGQTMLPAQAESEWMTSATVPQELQNRVTADSGTYWQSSSVRMDQDGPEVPVVIVGREVEPQQGSRYGLYLINDFSQPQFTLDAIHAVLMLSTLVQALLVSGVVGYVTREVVLPVSTTARVSESLADGNLGVRMQVEGSHEVARLGRSFNRMADNLEDQITRLERLSSMQQTFVSDVSHELRTPLTTVRMAAEVLHNAREDFDPVNRRSAELLYNQVDRFDTLLADLLEISRFDAGAARLDISGTKVFALLNEVLEAAAPLAANSGSVIRVHSDQQRCIVQMDQRRIDRILRNLLVNALEHGEGRPVDIVVRASDVAVGVAVRDHGIGMTEEQTQKVFDRFWRADPARARTTGGTGLGLSIAVEDTRLHGGRLDAWGSPGEGACFRLTLPLLRSRPLNDEDLSPVDLPPEEDELPSVAVVTDTGTFAAVPLDRDSVIAPVTETVLVVNQHEDADDHLDGSDLDGDGPEHHGHGTVGLADATDVDDTSGPTIGTDSPSTAAGASGFPPADAGGDQGSGVAEPGAIRPSIRAAAALEGPGASMKGARPAIGGGFLTSTSVSDEGVGGVYPPAAAEPEALATDEHEVTDDEHPSDDASRQPADHPAGVGVAQDDVDDLDEAYEDLYIDDTGELPAFRDPDLDDTPGESR